MKILLVEDDKQTSQFIRKGLRQEGYTIDVAFDGEDGLHLATTETYDLFILDVMLPSLNGIQLIKRIRSTGISAPAMFLSARSAIEDRVNGLGAGADDYLVKPFAFSELVARVQALLRRNPGTQQSDNLAVADLHLDLGKRKAFRNGQEIALQPKEFSLLEYLMRNTGRVISKTMIMSNVWDYNFDPQTTVVEARICRLRDKIDREFDQKLIHTIRGIGYVLEER